MADVIELGKYRVVHKKTAAGDKPCEHENFVLDEGTRTVTCEDCGMQLDAFCTLVRILPGYSDALEDLNERHAVLDAEGERLSRLQAATMVNDALSLDIVKRRPRRQELPVTPRTAEADR